MKIFKSPLFKTTGPISTKSDTKDPWVDGFQIFTDKGPHPSSRGDNSKIIKIYGEYLNYRASFNQTWHKASLGRGNSDFFQIKIHALLQWEIIANLLTDIENM